MSDHPCLKDPKCPAGHRLLLNMPDAETEAAARTELVRIFGREKSEAAELVAGSKTLPPDFGSSGHGSYRFTDQPTGYRAYLPWSFGT